MNDSLLPLLLRNDFLLPAVLLGGWTLYSLYYLIRAYRVPARINPYVLDIIPSIFPTIGIMCTAIGIAYGLSDFNANDIQGSLPKLLGGLKTAFYATILGIAGLIVFQKALAFVQHHIDASPDRPRNPSDELSALGAISTQLNSLEISLRKDLERVDTTLKGSNQEHNKQLEDLSRLITLQTDKAKEYHLSNNGYNDKVISSLSRLTTVQETHAKELNLGVANVVVNMRSGNDLMTAKFDEFSELMRKNNTEALVEVMRASTEQFNAQMSELINKLVKENFKELNGSVLMLNTWQKENKELVAKLGEQAKDVLSQVDIATSSLDVATGNLKNASVVLTMVAEVNQELVSDDGKLMTLVNELEKVMISDGKFTDIVDKVEGAVNTMSETTDAFYETTKLMNGSVSTLNAWQKENKEQVAELTSQVEVILEQVGHVTLDLEKTTKALITTAKLNHDLVKEDSKLMILVNELEKVMVSEGKFISIITLAENAIKVLNKSTGEFHATTEALNQSVPVLSAWQKENKEQVSELTGQVKIVLEQVDKITKDLKTSTTALVTTAKLNHDLVDDDSKLTQLVKELEQVMISDGKFTGIVDKVDATIDTLSETTNAFEETTQKLNVWVKNQMNFSDKAEVLIKQLEEFRNLNGSVWDKYRAEMEKSVKIVANASTTLSGDLENINQEFYDRLNDTLQNLDGLIQRFMNGQSTNRRS